MRNTGIFVSNDEKIKEVLKKLDKHSEKVMLVVDAKNKLIGTVTDGDIRRYILSGKDLNGSITGIYNKNPSFIKTAEYSLELARELLLKGKIELLPIVNNEGVVEDFITWDQAFSEHENISCKDSHIDIPVVIMAGGKGTRLEPFTKILPKPLIPVGDKPLIEIIINEFVKQGVDDYYLTLNYKGEMIESYFKSIETKYNLHYLWEKEFYGTAGSLSLLAGKISGNFIVTNCDVMVKANFKDVLEMHERQHAYLTILSSIQHHKIPYGVINFVDGGEVTDILEKPEYSFTINTGIYVLNKKALEFIPEKTVFNMTDLVVKLIENNKKVITYPVNENDYIDVGQWEEYKKTINLFEASRLS